MNTINTPSNTQTGTHISSVYGCYRLQRYPVIKKETLRAWDAADEYLLQYLADNNLADTGASLLILNDGFGGLSIPLHRLNPVVMTDSWLTMQAIAENMKINQLDDEAITFVDSLDLPDNIRAKKIDIILIKLPKSLAMVEDQLQRIRAVLNPATKIIAAGMSKHIHVSTLKLFEKIIGPTKTSLARKKARLIFSQFDEALTVADNAYPCVYKLPYKLDDVEIEVMNHAGVFSTEKLDVGTRLLLENIPADKQYKSIVDLGCGNGVAGLIAALKNSQAKLFFTDESYMAIKSSMANFLSVFSESREAEFLQTDCLQGIADNSISLVLCNPPFHQNNAVNDKVAWQMFSEAKAALEDKGELWVIGNRHLAYHAKLKKIFGNCNVIANNKKFVLLKMIKIQVVEK